MDSIEVIRRLHRHCQWSNGRLLDVATQISREKLHQSFEIGQGSIWKSLTHLYAAGYVWLEALNGNETPLTPGDIAEKLPGNQEGEGAISSLSELQSAWSDLDQRWNDYLDELTPDSLDQTVYKTSTSSGYGMRHGTTRADVFLHVYTHAQYTTAQVINMMRHVGAERLPDTMLITLAREEPGNVDAT